MVVSHGYPEAKNRLYRLQVVLKLIQPYTRIRITFVSTQVTTIPVLPLGSHFAVTVTDTSPP